MNNILLRGIDEIWNDFFKDVFFGKFQERKLIGPDSMPIRVVFNERNFDYIIKGVCPFDKPDESKYGQYRSLWYGINGRPVEEKHAILFPIRHGEWPVEQDITDALIFTSEVPYACSLNLADAGASISDHVHFQCLKERFPGFDDNKTILSRDDQIEIYLLSTPYSGILLKSNNRLGRERLVKIANLRRPYNLVLKSDGDKDHVLVYGREHSSSGLLDGFKIGAPEMARLFYAKTLKQYQNWDYSALMSSLIQVSLKDQQASDFIAEISDLVKK
jgi:hypothetical protein